MKTCWQFLYKAVVIEYFKQNVLFFLAIVLVAFGFLSGREHVTFAENIAASNQLLIYVFMFWAFYVVKVFSFLNQILNSPKFSILYKLQLIQVWKQVLLWASIVYILLLPIITYGYFIIVVSYKLTHFSPIFFIFLFQIVAVLVLVIYVESRTAKSPEREMFLKRFKILPKIDIITPFPLYFFRHLLSKYSISFLLIKLSSILLISFFVWLYPTDAYDMRLFGLMAIIIGAVNFRLVQLKVTFDDLFLSFYKNLPLGSLKTFSHLLLALFTISFPELFVFILNSPGEVTLIKVLSTYCLYFAFLLFATIIFSKYGVDSEKAIQILFFGMVVLSMIIMANVPFVIMSLSIFTISYFISIKSSLKLRK